MDTELPIKESDVQNTRYSKEVYDFFLNQLDTADALKEIQNYNRKVLEKDPIIFAVKIKAMGSRS